MTPTAARELVLSCLLEVAPDADTATLAPDAPLRETLELDSMDVLNLVAEIAERSGVEIADRDVAALATLDDFAGHVARAAVAR